MTSTNPPDMGTPGTRAPSAKAPGAGSTAFSGPRAARLVDVALGVFVMLVVATAIAADLGADTATPDPLAYGFAVGLGALMLVRRQLPVAVALVTGFGLIAYYMLDYPPIGLAVPVAAALYSVAESGRLRWAIGIAVGLLMVSTGFRLASGDDLAYVLGFELATSVTLMAAVVALGDAVRIRRELRAEAERRVAAAELEREREAQRRVADERLRIARDLHDVLAHTMSVITVQADVAAEAVDDDPDAVRDAVGAIRSTARSASAEIRSTVQVLRTAPPAGGAHGQTSSRTPVGGLADLDRVLAATRSAGIDVEVEVTGNERPLPLPVDTTALRLIQEALTNVRRHARASSIRVALGYGPDTLSVDVTDNGSGADPAVLARGAGFGIRGMRERAELLDGTLDIAMAPEGGVRVAAVLPVSGTGAVATGGASR